MCRAKAEGGQRCATDHAAHNTRRRASRARDATIRTLTSHGIPAIPGPQHPPQYFVGTGRLDTTQVDPAHDNPEAPRNKPTGGLWTSPALTGDHDYTGGPATGWSNWMERNGQLTHDHSLTKVTAAHDAVIVTLRDERDVSALATAYPPPHTGYDGTPTTPFSYDAARAAGIHAIHAHDDLTGYGKPLSGWDIESTVWLDTTKIRTAQTTTPAGRSGTWQDDWHDPDRDDRAWDDTPA